MSKIDIGGLFQNLQKQMVSQLNTNREFITHPGSKGDALEYAWIEWFRRYLPNRYNVEKGIVIDSHGNTSHQIDIIVFDNWYTPFLFTQNGFHYIPSEGVYAIFEVKPDIKGNVGKLSYMDYAGKKIESVRKLKRTSASMINSGEIRFARPLTKIIGGFLASSNSFTHKNNNTIESDLKKLTNFCGIDIGCIADYGSFYVDYSGEENQDLDKPKQFHQRIKDYYENRRIKKIIFSEPEYALITFFLQFTRYLQQAIGTVPAIDLNEYSKSINFKIDEEL